MIRPLIHDRLLLSLPSSPAGREDADSIQDLKDTLEHYRETCAGMAANMIGVRKNIIAVHAQNRCFILINAKITAKKGPYTASEGCLSYTGGPTETVRYREITAEYETEAFEKKKQVFTGFTAEVIQHELDHVKGILI